MAWREIPRTEWEAFLDGFSRQHRGWLVALERSGPHAERDRTLRRLRHVSVEDEHTPRGARRLSVTLDDDAVADGRLVVRVDSPQRILLEESNGGQHHRLAIEGPDSFIRLRFRIAASPETVNGVLD